MPPRRKSEKAPETADKPFKYPRVSREVMEEVRRRSYEKPYELSQEAETLIPTLPEDLRDALLLDFGEPTAGYPRQERSETNLNLARLIVAFSMQHQLDTDKQKDK